MSRGPTKAPARLSGIRRAAAFRVVAVGVLGLWVGLVPHLARAADPAPGSGSSQVVGTGFTRDSDKPIDVVSDAMDVDQNAKIAVFTGNVQIQQGDLRLRGERVIVHYATGDDAAPAKDGGAKGGAAPKSAAAKPAPAKAEAAKAPQGGGSGISRVEAKGKVFISSPTETAQGDWADYDLQTGLVKMGGAVVLTRGENVLKGTALELDLNSGRSRLTSPEKTGDGRVRGLFVPKKKTEGGDGGAKGGSGATGGAAR